MTITDNHTLDVSLRRRPLHRSNPAVALASQWQSNAVVRWWPATPLEERENCLSLMYVGASGKGKSVSVSVLMPEPSQRTSAFASPCGPLRSLPPSYLHAANKKKGRAGND